MDEFAAIWNIGGVAAISEKHWKHTDACFFDA